MGSEPASKSSVSDLSPVVELLNDPLTAGVYVTLLDASRPLSVSAIADRIGDEFPRRPDSQSTRPSDGAVRDRVTALERGGVVTPANGERYTASEFRLDFSTADATTTVTPDTVRVVAHSHDEAVQRLTRRGTGTVARFVSLAKRQAAGTATTRGIADTLGIPRELAFDGIHAVDRILHLGDESVETRDTGDDETLDELLTE